jgi:hypothetical protein
MNSDEYYKYIDVPELPQITQELSAFVRDTNHIDRNMRAGFTFCSMVPETVLNAAPSLRSMLERYGLSSSIERIGLPIVSPCTQGILHVDGASKQAFNMPVHNCDDSFTEWWENVDLDQIKEDVRVAEKAPTAPYLKCFYREDSRPVFRAKSKYAMWYNTSLPHRGINNSDRPRVIITIRFNVDIRPILCK